MSRFPSARMWAALVAVVAAFVALASPAGATTEPGDQHWRKGDQTGVDRQFLLYVHYDADVGYGSSIDPTIRDNYTAQFSAELNAAIAKLDAHPDLRVVRETRSTVPCHDNFPNPASEGDNRNCVEFYRVSDEWLFDRTQAVGTVGAAMWWQNPDHIWNDAGSDDPALQENSWVAIYHGLSSADPVLRANAFCHELAHTVDLDHPTDGTPGPCDGTGVLDADDNTAIDLTYCTRHVDGQPAPRASTLAGGDTAGGTPDPECSGVSAFDIDGIDPPHQVVVSDTRTELERGRVR